MFNLFQKKEKERLKKYDAVVDQKIQDEYLEEVKIIQRFL